MYGAMILHKIMISFAYDMLKKQELKARLRSKYVFYIIMLKTRSYPLSNTSLTFNAKSSIEKGLLTKFTPSSRRPFWAIISE
jgi:hypothetical protein